MVLIVVIRHPPTPPEGGLPPLCATEGPGGPSVGASSRRPRGLEACPPMPGAKKSYFLAILGWQGYYLASPKKLNFKVKITNENAGIAIFSKIFEKTQF